jgi:hypothetical protein
VPSCLRETTKELRHSYRGKLKVVLGGIAVLPICSHLMDLRIVVDALVFCGRAGDYSGLGKVA